MTTHLVIGDPHSTPDHDNERFTWLGKLVMDKRPDVIINIGDWVDMGSLCSYDKGKKSFEGRRFNRDIDCANDALDKFQRPMLEYNLQQASNRKKQYKPRMVWLDGNHDNRVFKAEEGQAEYEGMLQLHERLNLINRGWEVHRFLHPVTIDGVTYQHYFTSGPMGNPISGSYASRRILQEIYQSGTCGHSHYLQYTVDTTGDGRRLHGLVVGCYFEHEVEYASPKDQEKWWRGIAIKHNVSCGDYDLELIGMDRIKKEYR